MGKLWAMSDATTPGSDAAPADQDIALPDGLEFVRPLGRGQMARVYLARESELGRTVAVKILRAKFAADETARLRFEREARSAASLTHPNVVSVHRFGRLEDGTPYLVMSHVKGRTLADSIKADGPLEEGRGREVRGRSLPRSRRRTRRESSTETCDLPTSSSRRTRAGLY